MSRKLLSKTIRLSPNKKAVVASPFAQKYARTVLAPLSRKEAAVATQLALDDVVLRAQTTRGRVRVYGPFLRIEKPKRRGGPPRRMIWVRIRDRDQGVVHEISIEAETIVERVINPDANPPFSDEERKDAYRVILDDPKLRKLVAGKNVVIEWFNPRPVGRGRLIGARLVRIKDERVIESITEAKIELDQALLHEGGH